ncbi:IS3 family transposase OrfA [Escherichia coli]|nr:IS3 family transposase OrfA [Escherichia coli]
MTKTVSTSKKPRKQHSPEFRSEALKLAERIGVAAAARELSLYESQLYAWRRKLQQQMTSIRRQLVLPTRANYTGRTLQGDIKSRLLLPSLSFSCSFPLSVRTYIRNGSACLPQPPP